jgi:hypothetical membrane protein
MLNNQTAHYGLASDLERVGQPYYWLFILGDILTGISVVAACALIWIKLWPKLRSKTWATTGAGLLSFGLFTAVGTILPSECSVTPILRCGAEKLGLDGLFSGIAACGLLISLMGISVLGRRHRLSAVLTLMTQIILIAWATSGLLFVILAITDGKAHLLQQIFLIISGLALLAIGLNIEIAIRHNSVQP